MFCDQSAQGWARTLRNAGLSRAFLHLVCRPSSRFNQFVCAHRRGYAALTHTASVPTQSGSPLTKMYKITNCADLVSWQVSPPPRASDDTPTAKTRFRPQRRTALRERISAFPAPLLASTGCYMSLGLYYWYQSYQILLHCCSTVAASELNLFCQDGIENDVHRVL